MNGSAMLKGHVAWSLVAEIHGHHHLMRSFTATTALAAVSWVSFVAPLRGSSTAQRAIGSVSAPSTGSVVHPAEVTTATTTPAATPVDPVVLTPPSWRAAAATTTDVVFVGDSIAEQSAEPLAAAIAPLRVVRRYYGGTAACDWVSRGLPATPATLVIISFTGNSITPCMADGGGGHLDGAALLDRYRADVGALIDQARRSGARVLLVGQAYAAPHFRTEATVDGLNAMYRGFAAAWPDVAFVDAGRAVETDFGEYTDRLPCQPADRDCAGDGTTQVRSDGVHFCTVYGVTHCPVYASGARRFAASIAEAVQSFAQYD